MFPDQQNQSGVNSTPQQAPNGQYQVLPPLPTVSNTGHSGHNPYEFIVNPNTPKRGGNLFGSNSSVAMRLAIMLGGLVAVIILISLLVSAFSPKSNVTADMIALAQRQQEIVRVATGASQQATGQDTKNFVANAQVSVASSQQQTVAYLVAHGKKLNAKTLSLDKSAQTDTVLADAATANNYDAAVVQSLTTQLRTYEGQLTALYKESHVPQTKKQLQAAYDSADGLLKQAKPLSLN
jgi:hypothetical protein